MAGGDDLRALLGSDVGEEIVDIALPEDFQVGVGFVKKQDSPRIGKHVAQEEKHLLAPPAGR